MMNKRGDGSWSVEWMIYIILIIVVIVAFGFFLYKMGIIEDVDDIRGLFPGSDKGDEGDVPIVPGIVVEFDEPWKAVYKIEGRETDDLRYNCNEQEGWQYYNPMVLESRESGKARSSDWTPVTSTGNYEIFGKLKQKNKDFIISLQGDGCEDGLQKLVDRVEEDFKNKKWYQRKPYLEVSVGKKEEKYYPGSNEFKDIRILIKKINSMEK